MPFDLDGISAVTHGPQSFFNDFFHISFTYSYYSSVPSTLMDNVFSG